MKSPLLCPACRSPLTIGEPVEDFNGSLRFGLYCASGRCPSERMNDGVEIPDASLASQQAALAKLAAAWDVEEQEIINAKQWKP